MNFLEFLEKIKNTKCRLTKKGTDELEVIFRSYKAEVNQILNKLDKTLDKLNSMIFDLYKITENEKNIINNDLS